jgi:hypothetical protein
MPAAPLFKALKEHASKRVVISDVKEKLMQEAVDAGILATDLYIGYFLKRERNVCRSAATCSGRSQFGQCPVSA